MSENLENSIRGLHHLMLSQYKNTPCVYDFFSGLDFCKFNVFHHLLFYVYIIIIQI